MIDQEYHPDNHYNQREYTPEGCIGLLFNARKSQSLKAVSSSLASVAWSAHEQQFWSRRFE